MDESDGMTFYKVIPSRQWDLWVCNGLKTHKSLARLEALAGDYQESANNGTLTEDGWLDDFMTNYATSKFFINGITRIYG